MYIAFKWLLGITISMWIAVCFIDYKLNESPAARQDIDFKLNSKSDGKLDTESVQFADSNSIVHYLLFISGALVVSLYQNIHEIISFTRSKISKLYKKTSTFKLNRPILNETVSKLIIKIWIATIKIFSQTIVSICVPLTKKIKIFKANETPPKPKTINMLLLDKLQEVGRARKFLTTLLLSIIHENKQIKMRYELELLSKDRLIKRYESTQKDVQENRTRYVNFQQLYLVVQQDNIFLKSLVKKLTAEKEKSENTLMTLVGQVFTTKNNDLKAYCSRLIVRNDINLLKTDVKAEIDAFLNKSKQLTCTKDSKMKLCTDTVVPFTKEEPKMRGLPGEYVWTVKDKDGFIEKLYEYDYNNLDNGDSLRRIREYSVYHDKDCFLDEVKSRTIIQGHNAESDRTYMRSQNFLTGSHLFQNFVRNNLSLRPPAHSAINFYEAKA